MKSFHLFLSTLFMLLSTFALTAAEFALVIHGGSGVRDVDKMTPDLREQYTLALRTALEAGHAELEAGKSSVDAVTAAIVVLEDNPLFNAGKGAAFTKAGTNELDASIMRGEDLEAGGVCALQYVKNPILAARSVMEDTPHVLMTGHGALEIAIRKGLELVPSEYFWTEYRWNSLQERIRKNIEYGGRLLGSLDPNTRLPDKSLYGTVGAVALDRHGNIAAGTSTGGRTMKMPGRVGDSPLIGAATYADNKTCGISTTGLGEVHIVIASAKTASMLMETKGLSIQDAFDEVIKGRLVDQGGGGGAIGLDAKANIAMSFSGDGMYRGFIKADGQPHVFIYQEEEKLP